MGSPPVRLSNHDNAYSVPACSRDSNGVSYAELAVPDKEIFNADSADIEFAEVEVAPTLAVSFPGRVCRRPVLDCRGDYPSIRNLEGYIGRHGLAPIAPPRTTYTAYGQQGVEFTVAMPILAPQPAPPSEPPAVIDNIRGAKAYRFTHHGSYSKLMQTTARLPSC